MGEGHGVDARGEGLPADSAEKGPRSNSQPGDFAKMTFQLKKESTWVYHVYRQTCAVSIGRVPFSSDELVREKKGLEIPGGR